MKNITISIGIPAYNEEHNIKRLISSILNQKHQELIKEIIIISDGSNDSTVLNIEKISNPKIKLIKGEKRLGKATRLKEIIGLYSGDLLILMDADIVIKDRKLFSKIVLLPYQKSGIISVKAIPLNPSGFFEKIINYSINLQTDLRSKWNKGRNYLSFRGVFLALTSDFARSLPIYGSLINDDTYLYLLAKKYGYFPLYAWDLCVYYKCPSNFKEHLLQSSRFSNSKKVLRKYFNSIDEEFKIPKILFIKTSLKYLFKNPFYFVLYVFIYFLTRIMKISNINQKWNVSFSTKVFPGKNI